jgi:hypothetical protein
MHPISKRELDAARQVVLELPVPVDRIPYTPWFDQALKQFCQLLGLDVSADRAWHIFLSVRKRGYGKRRFRKQS